MAEHALSTSLSRRTMLTSAAALVPAVAVPLDVASVDRDAELLCCLRRTARLRAAWLAACEEAERLFMETYRHPDFSRPRGMTRAGRLEFEALAIRTGYRAAADRAGRVYDLYVKAGTRAFVQPARTLSGLAAKLHLAVAIARAGREGDATVSELAWLDLAVADLERRIRKA